MRWFLGIAVALGTLSVAAVGQTQPSGTPSIVGVWSGISLVITGANASANMNRQPSLLIYTKRYFSRVTQDATVPLPPRPVLAPPKDPANLTEAEKLARYEHWAPVAGLSGMYEMSAGSVLQFTLVNKNQSADIIARNAGGRPTDVRPDGGQEIRLEGDRLVLAAKSADSTTTATYRRLETPSTSRSSPVEGVWKGTSAVVTGPNPASAETRQPNIFIYTKGYFSTVRQDAGIPMLPPRPVLAPPRAPNNLTDAEKLARFEHWLPVAINAGRYLLTGSTLSHFDLVAKNQNPEIIERNTTGNLGRAAPALQVEFPDTNTMVQIQTSGDGKTVTRRTFVRVE